MTMTDVTITIGGNNVSNSVIDVDIYKNKDTGIGNCELILDNDSDTWGDTFNPNDAVSISINGDLVFTGYVDDVVPKLEKTGVLTNRLRVKTRDDGRILTDYYVTTPRYNKTAAGVIITNILSEAGDPLTYSDPGGTPSITYKCKRTKLSDALNDISKLSGWDYYVDTTGELHFFEAGTVDSGVDLISEAGGANNNLLSFEEYESIGVDIKNYIEIHGGSLKDHWTEGNASDWSVLTGAGTTMDDDDSVHHPYGDYSVEIVVADTDETVGLDFSGGLYSQGTSIDLTEFCQSTIIFIPKAGSTGAFSFQPYLKDGSGRDIFFYRSKDDGNGRTNTALGGGLDADVFSWRILKYPMGEHTDNEIVDSGTTTMKNGKWHGNPNFDWSDVEQLGFNIQVSDTANVDTIYVDMWSIPSLEVKSISEDSGAGSSQETYGKRMYSEYKKELTSQGELDDYSAKQLALKKDPVKKFKALAVGETGTLYAAQSVDVLAPGYGIAALTDYIIVELHHILHNDDDERGWDYVTEYELAESDVDATRIIYTDNPVEAELQALRKANRGYKGSVTDDDYWIGNISLGVGTQILRGTEFPTDQNDGDEFFLTTDYTDGGGNEYYGPALYKYDDDAGDWVRNPIVMHRGADPNAGGEVTGDTLHRTDEDKWYEWTGAAWSLIEFAASTVSGELDADQLSIEMRPWSHNLELRFYEDAANDYASPVIDRVYWGKGGEYSEGVDADDSGFSEVNEAQVKFDGGTTVDINSGDSDDDYPAGLAVGKHFLYWDETEKTGDDYDLQIASGVDNYGDAVGSGKGLIAIIGIDASGTPTLIPVDSYFPYLGVGVLNANTVLSRHITATEWITGKNFQTAVDVGSGSAGIKFNSNGIIGYTAGGDKTVEMEAGTGHFIAYGNAGGGAGSFRINIGGDNYGWISCQDDGADEVVEIRGDNQIWMNVFGDLIKLLPNKEIQAKSYNIENAPADDTGTGITKTFIATEAIAIGQAVYLDDDGDTYAEVGLARAHSYATMPCIGIATSTAAADGDTLTVLLFGVMEDTSRWSGFANPGDGVYVSESTAGDLTTTQPSGSGELVQRVGEVTDDGGELLFAPNKYILELA